MKRTREDQLLSVEWSVPDRRLIGFRCGGTPESFHFSARWMAAEALTGVYRSLNYTSAQKRLSKQSTYWLSILSSIQLVNWVIKTLFRVHTVWPICVFPASDLACPRLISCPSFLRAFFKKNLPFCALNQFIPVANEDGQAKLILSIDDSYQSRANLIKAWTDLLNDNIIWVHLTKHLISCKTKKWLHCL